MITSIPRIDLVVWILISRVIPDAVHRLRAIQGGEFRSIRLVGGQASRVNGKILGSRNIDTDRL